MPEEMYSKRLWLNQENSPSTGAVVAYHGAANWKDGEVCTFLELSDCHGKVRLHKAKTDSTEDFIRKLRKLAGFAHAFADFLELYASEQKKE